MIKSIYINLTKSLFLFIALLFTFIVNAHDYTPAYLGLQETTVNQFQVIWKVDTMAGLNKRLLPTFSEPCKPIGEKKVTTNGETEIHFYTLNCLLLDSELNVFIKGLSGSKTDVLLRVSNYEGGTFTHRLIPNSPQINVPTQLTSQSVISTYTLLGAEHILIGIDHLLFVFALLLLITNFSALIKTITAFTIAHSITLAAITLGWITVASKPVETVIAISILFLALQLAKQQQTKGIDYSTDLTSRYPWLVAASFGLLHGFGFAGALAEIGLPEQAIPLALLFFNVGVELGQILFILISIGIGRLFLKLNLPYPKQWKLMSAYIVGSLSVFWIFERSVWLVN